MGLDITAYEKVTLVRAMTVKQANAEDYDPYDRKETLLYLDHPSRTQHDGMTEGAYAYDGETMHFRAGSYGGYNQWRSWLAAMTGTTDQAIWDNPKPGPFVELIHFSDCEGFIGPQTSAKLAKDFEDWADRAVAFSKGLDADDGRWFGAQYDKWANAFHIAAKGGAVKFH